MRAAWYERQGDPDAVLVVGEMVDPQPGPGEVRIHVRASGINPGDVKKREAWLGPSMPYPRVIPHSDGAGEIDAVGEGVSEGRIGERVWCYGAQSYRPFGTAAEFVVVPEQQAVELPVGVEFEQGACLGIPGITAHRALFADGSILHATVLVAGAAGAVGATAIQLARWGGAKVLATVREEADIERARRAGAAEVFLLDGGVAQRIKSVTREGVDRVVEVALSANAALDAEVIAQGGVLAVYSSPDPEPALPFWPLLFSNVTIRLLGSDDFPSEAKRQAAHDIVNCLKANALRAGIGARFPLEQIANAHRAVSSQSRSGRVVLTLS